jgi:prophage DNA circulation protein
MSILDGLDEWSFDGVPFLAKEAPTTSGRSVVIHEFVNSSRRDPEDQGEMLEDFKLSAIISNKGGQYFAKRNALINVLKKGPNTDGSPKILSHGFLGKFEVVAKPYTLVEKFSELGAAFFSLTFARVSRGVPLPELFTLSNIEVSRTDTMDALAAEFAAAPPKGFKVSQAFPFNFSAAINLLNGIGAQFDDVTKTFNRALQEIDDFAAALNDFKNSIRRLINLPGQLVSSLTNLFNSVVALSETPEESFLTLEKLFVFGDDFKEIPETAAELIEKKINQDLLVAYIQVGALSYAYEQTANIDFFTIREIDTFSEKLNTQFDKVFDLIRDTSVASELQNLRNITNEFLDIQRLNAKKIVEIATQPTTAQALMYQYYGNVDDFEKFTQLNSIKDVSFADGSVEIFR